jgi:hypothetical protein
MPHRSPPIVNINTVHKILTWLSDSLLLSVLMNVPVYLLLYPGLQMKTAIANCWPAYLGSKTFYKPPCPV